jgi:hypothetical protein
MQLHDSNTPGALFNNQGNVRMGSGIMWYITDCRCRSTTNSGLVTIVIPSIRCYSAPSDCCFQFTVRLLRLLSLVVGIF